MNKAQLKMLWFNINYHDKPDSFEVPKAIPADKCSVWFVHPDTTLPMLIARCNDYHK